MNFAIRQEAGDGLHVAAAQPSARLKEVPRLPQPRIDLGTALVKFCLRNPHALILADAGLSRLTGQDSAKVWTAFIIGPGDFPCQSTSTSANNVTTSLRLWFTEKRKRNARSATPRSLSRNSRSSLFQRKVHRIPRRPPVLVGRVEIHAVP